MEAVLGDEPIFEQVESFRYFLVVGRFFEEAVAEGTDGLVLAFDLLLKVDDLLPE